MTSLANIRSFRVAGVAIFDVVASAIGIWLLMKKLKNGIEPWRALSLAIPVGILVHVIFGVSTPLTDEFMSMKITGRNIATVAMLVAGVYL
jgi:hypothetical protein